VVFAQFSAWKPLPNDRGYGFNTVADWLRTQIKAPVFTGLPFGHVPTKLSLPQFTPARLMVDGRDALLYWG
jgi:muramoyltetrapeptide carboxypeptidase